jgi:aerobic carbon-monoxide dehydrogenase medium subunit
MTNGQLSLRGSENFVGSRVLAYLGVKPAPFDYLRAGSIDEAVRALADADGDAKILAGGQSLMPVLALRMARPRLLVDIDRIPGLSTIAHLPDSMRIGALVRHSRLVEQPHHPLLAKAAKWIGHTAVRSRGTIGGSIAHADPAAELPVVAAAPEATIHIAGGNGPRSVTAADFFTGALEATLGDDEIEIITGVDMPQPTRWGFAEFARRHGDFGLVTVAAAEVVGRWRLAIGGVGRVPVRPREAEELLNTGARSIDPTSDIHGSGDYRRAVTREFTHRAVNQSRRQAAA